MVCQGSGSFSPSSLPNEFVFLPLLQPPTLVTTIPLLHSWVTDSFLKWKCIGCAVTDRYASHPRNHVSHCLMSMCPEVGTQNTHSAPPLLLVSHSGLSLYRGEKNPFDLCKVLSSIQCPFSIILHNLPTIPRKLDTYWTCQYGDLATTSVI